MSNRAFGPVREKLFVISGVWIRPEWVWDAVSTLPPKSLLFTVRKNSYAANHARAAAAELKITSVMIMESTNEKAVFEVFESLPGKPVVMAYGIRTGSWQHRLVTWARQRGYAVHDAITSPQVGGVARVAQAVDFKMTTFRTFPKGDIKTNDIIRIHDEEMLVEKAVDLAADEAILTVVRGVKTARGRRTNRQTHRVGDPIDVIGAVEDEE
jgi:hypothetical protein